MRWNDYPIFSNFKSFPYLHSTCQFLLLVNSSFPRLLNCALALMAEQRNTSVVSASGRRHTVDEGKLHVTSVFTKKGEHAVIDYVADADEEILVALGYKQEFKRFARPQINPFRSHILLIDILPVISPGSSPFLSHSPFWVFSPQSHRL